MVAVGWLKVNGGRGTHLSCADEVPPFEGDFQARFTLRVAKGQVINPLLIMLRSSAFRHQQCAKQSCIPNTQAYYCALSHLCVKCVKKIKLFNNQHQKLRHMRADHACDCPYLHIFDSSTVNTDEVAGCILFNVKWNVMSILCVIIAWIQTQTSLSHAAAWAWHGCADSRELVPLLHARTSWAWWRVWGFRVWEPRERSCWEDKNRKKEWEKKGEKISCFLPSEAQLLQLSLFKCSSMTLN